MHPAPGHQQPPCQHFPPCSPLPSIYPCVLAPSQHVPPCSPLPSIYPRVPPFPLIRPHPACRPRGGQLAGPVVQLLAAPPPRILRHTLHHHPGEGGQDRWACAQTTRTMGPAVTAGPLGLCPGQDHGACSDAQDRWVGCSNPPTAWTLATPWGAQVLVPVSLITSPPPQPHPPASPSGAPPPWAHASAGAAAGVADHLRHHPAQRHAVRARQPRALGLVLRVRPPRRTAAVLRRAAPRHASECLALRAAPRRATPRHAASECLALRALCLAVPIALRPCPPPWCCPQL